MTAAKRRRLSKRARAVIRNSDNPFADLPRWARRAKDPCNRADRFEVCRDIAGTRATWHRERGDYIKAGLWRLARINYGARMRANRLRCNPAVSNKLIRFVTGWEGFHSCPYKDPVGVWTVGYGETDGVGPNTPCMNEREARRLLRRRLNRDYLPAVLSIPHRLNQREIDALTSFVYNLGPGVLTLTASYTIARRLRSAEARHYAGRKRIYREELPKFVKGLDGRVYEGLVKRRAAEVAIANRGDYSGRP